MDNKEIKNLMKLFDDSSIGELRIKREDFEIEFKKSSSAVVSSPVLVQETPVINQVSSAPTPVISNEVSGDFIKSPMVGTFYSAPSPDSAPFVKVGDTVSSGQGLCIVEAMKIMNEIECEFSCKIVDVLVKDGDPIEFDMPIFKVEKI
ncbi:MAG: Biotin carboxyl carrier protein of acetyl-CoA carboxylase [uncultured Campylobacterales bacterium]|uniref:Biotin carboxyl carrier protein of acetyl-CoA carboxylase n=1 Tax=uncultured Campylobacterales bacterium TaxID=352960 RepID=A0A6S6TFW3_9BACT|nr:MAG: Biotin carboxyl carrier protein of acetyl-CoA carboxylase [uncultured Campylobacterales bacterium]